LELSAQPQERAAQVRVLKDVFSLLERQNIERRAPQWDYLDQVAQAPTVAAAVDALLAELPADEDFGSFAELQSRRDERGVARSRR
jgi:hypothetical protein